MVKYIVEYKQLDNVCLDCCDYIEGGLETRCDTCPVSKLKQRQEAIASTKEG